jgi:altronate dehydratase large subunit
MQSPQSRIAQKTGLAAAGAHVILSPLAAGLPAGCPVAPVVHAGIAPYARPFAGDVDVMLDEDPRDGAAASLLAAIVAACGTETPLEAMGDFEMGIHRIAPTM